MLTNLQRSAAKLSRQPNPNATAPSKHPSTEKSTGNARPAKPPPNLKAELRRCSNQTKRLEKALSDITSRLEETQTNLAVAKRHHHDAMEHTRESKKIICRYLQLGMAIPPCDSLDLPMEIYSDDSSHKLATVIREQENQIARLERGVGEVRGELALSRRRERGVKRRITIQQRKKSKEK